MKIWILALVIIGVIFVSGCIDTTCDEDLDCFQEALRDCDRTTVKLYSRRELRYEFEITGQEGDSCKIHWTNHLYWTYDTDCLIKINTNLSSVAAIRDNLENCSESIRS